MAKQVNDNSKFTGIRLPSSLKPVHYDLKLKPNLADFTFSGTVRIDYSSSEVPKCIVLNADELVISDGEAKAESGKNPLTSVTYSKTSETATLEFQDTLEPEGSVSLNFTGTLNDRMVGFYRTGFQLNDTTVYAATTQLEACEARKCFPCWDEPSFKATFSVTIVYNKYLEAGDKKYENVAISNMPEESRSGSDEELAVKFAKSPIMSTYLLAFIVGPFEFIEGHDTKRPIRVYTTPGKKEQGEFALEVACKSLRFYEDYFGVEYPLPKMDMIAVPDFSSGAMENWGLVTYRETCILFDPNNSATRTKQYIAIVVAHELAHQWFGNLVTMEWWTHLWLNEGFASFMEYLCVDHIYPEYDIWTQFVTDSYLVALDLDALKNSHPIEVPVKHPSEIDQIFDDISYNKGASVIRMLHAYIGDDSFRKGMKDYLTKFAYNNAVTEDLWDSLEAASNKPVRKLMSGWTSQKGFPWLSLSYAAEGDKVKIGLTQHKFTADGKEDEDGASWMIPISCVTSKEPLKAQELCLIDGQSAEVTLDVADSDWFKLNPNTIGLYRTAYPEEVLSKLLPAIRDQSLAPLDRLGLQNDLFALSKAGKASTVDLLKLLQAFKNEDNFSVWSSVDSCIGELKMLISNTDYSEMFDAYGRDLYSEIFKKVGWEPQGDETPLVAMTRALVLNRLVSLGEREVIDEAKERFRAHMSGGAQVPADLRAAVYRAVSAYGDDESFEGLFNIAKTAELSEERNRALRMLSFARSDDRLNQAIEYVMSDSVRNQDKTPFLMVIGAANPPVGWRLLQDHGKILLEKFGGSPRLQHLIKQMASNFASNEKADEVTEFFNQNKFPSAAMAIQQSIETIRLNSSWLVRDGDKLSTYLDSFSDDDESEDDDVKVTIEPQDHKPIHPKPQPQPQAQKPTAINLEAGQAIEIDSLEDKPWRKPGADISDYFNYGFDEEIWKAYCEKQKRMRSIVNEIQMRPHPYIQEAYPIPVVSAAPIPLAPPMVLIPPHQESRSRSERDLEPDRDRIRERDRERTRDRVRDREREKERDRERESNRDRVRDRERDRVRDRDREREREKKHEPESRRRDSKKRRSRSRSTSRSSKRHKTSRRR